MTYSEVTSHARRFYAVVLLEKHMPASARRAFRSIFLIALALVVFISILAPFGSRFMPEVGIFSELILHMPLLMGVGIILFLFSMSMLFLEFFYRSHYFAGVPETIENSIPHRNPGDLSLEVAKMLWSNADSPADAFIYSNEGREILLRAEVDATLFSSIARTSWDTFVVPDGEVAGFLRGLTFSDPVRTALFKNGMTLSDIEGAAEWCERARSIRKQKERWWSRDNLGRIRGIGKDWSYGRLPRFSRYAKPLSTAYSSRANSLKGDEALKNLESILARREGANAILLGERGSGALEVLSRLQGVIHSGKVLPPLEHKEIFLFAGPALIASARTKANFEVEFELALKEAREAGNIILVFDELPSFIENARAIESDVVALLEPYLKTSDMHIVGVSDLDGFHKVIEPQGALMEYFEKVSVGAADGSEILRVLEDAAIEEENRSGVIFTYPAIKTIVESAERYFMEDTALERVFDLMHEAVPYVKNAGNFLVSASDIRALVESKSGIPTGEVKGEEKEKLLNLEKLLHERVIGQDEAIESISNAVRRARSGIQNPNRPLGSFLFLGPTGVGKTETAKALAEVFFKDEEAMVRIDMSEYSDEEALPKLIGSFQTGKVGILAARLKEKPYGVLLLDEFEKAATDVHDLFLQILDEGVFSDKDGKRVNVRNVIIIATSNAASDLIWKYFEKGENVTAHSKEVVDAVISQNIFRPELLNRFDGVIIFHPLDENARRQVATLMLGKLQKRLLKQGVDFVVNDVAIDFVVQQGSDPAFGARPMNRAIQEKIEKIIAEKKIKGELPRGSKFELAEVDLS